jgi:glucose-6-phosphate dehydrogenase assembly protein OpcA
MAETTSPAAPESASDAFLEGRGIPVPLERVEEELARLWGPSAERAGGPDLANPTVTRVSLANLVVARLGDDAAHVDEALDTVLSRHPCRAIVMHRGEGGDRIAVEVSAQCFLPAPGLPQVCSERINLGAGPEALDMLPGAVRTLLEPDLPLVLWWAGDPRPFWPVFRDLADEATRLIADLADPGAEPEAVRRALDPEPSGCPFGRDIAWFGVTGWRELVAQFFDPPGAADALRRLRAVEIVADAPRVGRPPRVGAWLAAWLAGQLGWTLRECDTQGGNLNATFEGPGGPIRVDLRTQVEPSTATARVRAVTLTASPAPERAGEGDEVFRVVRLDGCAEVRVEACSSARCALARFVRCRELDEADRVAAALESRRHDPPYFAARPHLFRLIGA